MNVKPTPTPACVATVTVTEPHPNIAAAFVLAPARVTVIDFYPARAYPQKEQTNGN